MSAELINIRTSCWPYHLAIYSTWCGETGRAADDPDSAEAFAELYALPPGTDGICDKCGEPAPAAWAQSTDWEEFQGSTVPRTTNELLGSACCHATLFDAQGTEIAAYEIEVRL